MYFGRGKNKKQNVSNASDIYKDFCKITEGIDRLNVDQKTFIAIVSDFYKGVVKNILYNAKTFMMPYGLGYLCIYKKKATNFRTIDFFIDWKKTVETGKQVYHLNEHSNGWNYSIEWVRGHKVANIDLYRFDGARAFKRELAYIIKNRITDYFEKH